MVTALGFLLVLHHEIFTANDIGFLADDGCLVGLQPD